MCAQTAPCNDEAPIVNCQTLLFVACVPDHCHRLFFNDEDTVPGSSSLRKDNAFISFHKERNWKIPSHVTVVLEAMKVQAILFGAKIT